MTIETVNREARLVSGEEACGLVIPVAFLRGYRPARPTLLGVAAECSGLHRGLRPRALSGACASTRVVLAEDCESGKPLPCARSGLHHAWMTTVDTPQGRPPNLPWPDDTWRFLRDGYLYGSRGFEKVGDDCFRTRLTGRPVIVMRGLSAARHFYEGASFDRAPGSVPRSVVRLLQDHGSVQSREGTAHEHRKQVFLRLLPQSDNEATPLLDIFVEEWAAHAEVAASRAAEVPLLDVASSVLAATAQRWVGIPRETLRTDDLTSMIDNAGIVGPANWLARARRRGTERAIGLQLERARLATPTTTPVSTIAHHREEGALLPIDTAAVELINLLRPIVAVARYIVFAAVALEWHPEHRQALASDAAARRRWAHEVRRYFPFFPLIGGRARVPSVWRNVTFSTGDWALLDLYGTDHHPAIWREPNRFDPARFMGDPAPVVAQGFGDAATTHHCPGESLTTALCATAVDHIVNGPDMRLVGRDLRISLRRIPAVPEDRGLARFS